MSKAKSSLTALKGALETGDAEALATAIGDCFHAAADNVSKAEKAATAKSTAESAECAALCDEIAATCAAGEPKAEEGLVGAIAWGELFQKLVAQLPAIISIFKSIFG
jgi:hypothetical protein